MRPTLVVLALRLAWPSSALAVEMIELGGDLKISSGGKPVLSYNIAVDESPDPARPLYRRSGYIHPIYDPAGRVITDDFPPDHLHQHALMFAHTKCLFDGRPVNFWDQHSGKGTVLHDSLGSLDPATGGFVAALNHLDLGDAEKPVVVLRETWSVRVHDAAGEYYLFDIESSQTAAGDKPLAVQQYHYGGMAIRGARQWFEKGKGDFLTSQGKSRADGNHSRPRWVDIYGLIDGRWSGIAVLCHPGNFRFPQPVRLHESKPYFSWSPQVLGGFEITRDKPHVSRYRHIVHMGKPDPAFIERMWAEYVK